MQRLSFRASSLLLAGTGGVLVWWLPFRQPLASEEKKRKLRIYVARHGETSFNKEQRFMGWLDKPLNDNGLRQAEQLASKFRGCKCDAIISSPLQRAKQTALEIRKVHPQVPFFEYDGLRENHLGELQGKLKKDVYSVAKHITNQWSCGDLSIRYPGDAAESPAIVWQRAKDALLEFAELPSVQDGTIQNVIAVCHGGTMTFLAMYIWGMTYSEIRKTSLPNCCVMIVDLDLDTMQFFGVELFRNIIGEGKDEIN